MLLSFYTYHAPIPAGVVHPVYALKRGWQRTNEAEQSSL